MFTKDLGNPFLAFPLSDLLSQVATLLIAPRPSLQIPSWLPSWESNGRWSLRPLFPYTNYPYSPGRSEAILDLNRVLQTPFYNGGSPITDLPSGYQP